MAAVAKIENTSNFKFGVMEDGYIHLLSAPDGWKEDQALLRELHEAQKDAKSRGFIVGDDVVATWCVHGHYAVRRARGRAKPENDTRRSPAKPVAKAPAKPTQAKPSPVITQTSSVSNLEVFRKLKEEEKRIADNLLEEFKTLQNQVAEREGTLRQLGLLPETQNA